MDLIKYQPVIKWTGSKRPVALQLVNKFPLNYNRYFEPFLGGGALLPYSNGKIAFANDIISELIELWKLIQKEPYTVYEEYKRRWNELQNVGAPVYYMIRDDFNRTRNPHDFMFLSRTCVNGLIRFNKDNNFNNSYHVTRPGIDPERLLQILLVWSKAIQNVTFMNTDYRVALNNVEKDDFVFIDPPYGGAKDRYINVDFNVDELYETLEDLNKAGVKWMMTFDGKSGKRKYDFHPPQELYKTSFPLMTGHSTFVKTECKKMENVIEMVYMNY